jgi:large subunit ribosomal protein L4
MTVDIVNESNERVGSFELNDGVFGGRVNASLIWESVVRQNAAARRGTHATKNRALVSGSGRKPWRQKGTGRARVGEIRNPLWRKGGTVFGPQPRSYAYTLPHKVELGALRAAISQKINDGALVIVEALTAADAKTKAVAETLARWQASRRALLLDVKPDENLQLAVRNLPKVKLVAARRVTARDVADATRVVATRAAVEHLQQTLGPGAEQGSKR